MCGDALGRAVAQPGSATYGSDALAGGFSWLNLGFLRADNGHTLLAGLQDPGSFHHVRGAVRVEQGLGRRSFLGKV